MKSSPPKSTPTDTLFPSTTVFRSQQTPAGHTDAEPGPTALSTGAPEKQPGGRADARHAPWSAREFQDPAVAAQESPDMLAAPVPPGDAAPAVKIGRDHV